MVKPCSAEPSQAEINGSAAVLLHLLTWRDRFDNDEAVRSLREAKLDVAVVAAPLERPRVHEAVLKALRGLAGRTAVWDSAAEAWRARRKGDPA